MTPALMPSLRLGFELAEFQLAHEPPEARGLARDGVRLMVSHGDRAPQHRRFTDLAEALDPGDLLVVNTSATVAAAVDGLLGGEPVVVHLSTELPGGVWLVEVRQPVGGSTSPRFIERPTTVHLLGGGSVRLLTRFTDSQRLWLAELSFGADVLTYLEEHGRPIRYGYVPVDWPLSAYQSVFSRLPGSAEMPSASRPFTTEVVADLVRHGVTIAPLVLHTGVSSLEGHEAPYPERYEVPRATAALVNSTHAEGGRVVAVGTTVVRALATVTDERTTVHPGRGWTDVVVSPEQPPRAVDGLITGWHEPEASHLLMLEAVAGPDAVMTAYHAAFDGGYLWHEFGDSHLLLAERGQR
ncbi:MAG: Queuosine biosynthesis protein [Acidimicrobiia bacterium]|nr:Queuosine biosynthesis protein [Acidimicrobiia bacterium]